MKATLLKYEKEVKQLVDLHQNNIKGAVQDIHTKSVQDSIANYQPNRVLQATPPKVDVSALKLDRRDRSLLSQLRSGFSNSLQSYKARLDPSIPDQCPKCKISPHDTNHLFICPKAGTSLSPRDLWDQPGKVLDFLKDNGYT